MATVEEIHAQSKVVEVDVAKLQVDPLYQRDVSEKLVDEIANNFDDVAAELITVSDRGPRNGDTDIAGGMFIVNGQHRTKGGQKAGRKKMWARLIDLRKEKDPAMIEARFRLATNRRIADRPLERFRAQLCAGDQESLAIKKILDGFETQINVAANPETGINCVSAIESLYRLDEGTALEETLKIVRDVFEKIGGPNTNAAFLKGIAWFIDKHAEESDRDRLVAKMTSAGRNTLEARARSMSLTMGGALWMNYYRALVDLYNEQLREKNRLHYKTRGKSRLSGGGGSQRAN